MHPQHKAILENAAALIEASRDEIRDRCASTTGQKLEAAAVDLRSIVADAPAAPEPVPEQPAAAPAPAPAPLDVAALSAEIAQAVTAQVLAALQPAPAPVPAPAESTTEQPAA